METIKRIALILTIVGALNWGLIGLFNINLVTLLISSTLINNILYIVIGTSALISIAYLFQEKMTQE